MKKNIKTLSPAYFALVMATGIVSLSCHLLKYDLISNVLFWLNIIQFAILLIFFLLRLVLFFPELRNDLSSFEKGAGYLTLVAGTCLLGLQFALLKQSFPPAIILWFFALIAWLIILYSFLTFIIIKASKPDLEHGINGLWLLITVSTQSLSILCATLSPHLPFDTDISIFISLALYLLGFMFYIILISIIFYRLTFYRVTSQEVTPPYWIDMGAAAITTLSGATLILNIRPGMAAHDFTTLLKPFMVLSWAIGTWWMPLVFILDIWRNFYKKVPFKYQPANWSLVFSLGMYTVCTIRLSEALQFPFIHKIADVFIFIAIAAWLVTFVSMCYSLMTTAKADKAG